MANRTTLIGFGEAAMAFCASWARAPGEIHAFDIKTVNPETAEAKWREFEHLGVVGAENVAQAIDGVRAILALVTADQALSAAQAAGPFIHGGSIWFDMNSVAPDTKRAAARVIEAAGARYVDVAVMAPVHPKGAAVPLLVSGPHGDEGAEILREIGFSDVTNIPGPVGRASSIKMIRSVMVKGIEALTAECLLAAARADVLDEVLASLDASPAPAHWNARADYNLDRMMVHGLRRAAEMEEVVKTLDALATGSPMARATAERQRALGILGITPPPEGLRAKLAALSLASLETGTRTA